MTKKFWAVKHNRKVGPCDTREDAVKNFGRVFPFKGESWEASNTRNQIMTGYGEFGPSFDIRWHCAPMALPTITE